MIELLDIEVVQVVGASGGLNESLGNDTIVAHDDIHRVDW